MATSGDTVLRALRRTAPPAPPAPRAVGVDDWAHRRGRVYGAIVVDLERHAVLDLLPDRSADTVAAWLAQHPGVAVVSRDRWEAFADGIRRGAPAAIQVVDRLHLVKNLGATLETFFHRRHAVLDETTAQLRQRAAGAASGGAGPDVAADAPPSVAPAQAERRARRLRRYAEVARLHALGWTQTAIAAHLPIDRKTIRRWRRAGAFPARRPPARRRGVLTPHEGHLRERWAEGCHGATVLYQELQARGDRGSASRLRHYLSGWRRRSPRGEGGGPQPAPEVHVRSPQQASWLLFRRPAEWDDAERAALAVLREINSDVATVYTLAPGFRALVRARDPTALAPWLEAAEQGEVPEVRAFAQGLRQDVGAVEAALRLPWSHGQVDGQIHRLTLIKRPMVGRAKLDLLRQRVLHAG